MRRWRLKRDRPVLERDADNRIAYHRTILYSLLATAVVIGGFVLSALVSLLISALMVLIPIGLVYTVIRDRSDRDHR